MKQLFKWIGKITVILFWLGAFLAPALEMPHHLNLVLPIIALVVLLIHWAQASMLKRACAPYFALGRREYLGILLFGVFGALDIRDRLLVMAQKPLNE